MSELPPVTLRWLADHHGVVTAAVLRDHHVGRSTISRLVAAGVLRRASKGVFVVATGPETLEQRCAVLCAGHPAGFVTGPTAGALAGLRRMPRTSALHFSLRHGVHLPEELGVRFRQTTALRPDDRARRDDGLVVASWPRLAFDLAADLRQLDHLSVVNQLLHEKTVTTDELVAIGRRLAHPARLGSTVYQRTMQALDGSPPNESHPEVVLAEALRRRGVPVEHQTRLIKSSSSRVYRIDLAVPALRWGIELDIHPEHRTFDGHAADARRRRDMHRVAWQIETVTEADMADPEAIAAELVDLFHARRRQVAERPSVS